MKRSAIKRRPTNPERQTPPSVLREVCERAGGEYVNGQCIGAHCEDCQDKNRDWRGLQFSHTEHRKMGGTTSSQVHSAANVKVRCAVCHDKLDGRHGE